MYLMITSKCNMSCAHCCMSCGRHIEGQHMTDEVFFKALEWAEDYGELVVLGGGEPTLHPSFMKYLSLSIKYHQVLDEGLAWFATNGWHPRTVEWITESKEISVEFYEELQRYSFLEYSDQLFSMAVSKDPYHDHIDDSIYDIAKIFDVEIRNSVGKEMNNGHCDFGDNEDACICPTVQVKPDGEVFLCGCDEAPRIGNVLDTVDYSLLELLSDQCSEYCVKWLDNCDKPTGVMTQKDWVVKNMPVKKGYENHPDVHRKLEVQNYDER